LGGLEDVGEDLEAQLGGQASQSAAEGGIVGHVLSVLSVLSVE
jgi:hypothetical protein